MTTEQNPTEKGGNVARIVDRLSKDMSAANSANHSATNGTTQKVDALLRKAQQNQSAAKGQQQHFSGKAATTVGANTNLSPSRHVVACFSYTAQMNDELDLCEGDEITVLEDVEDGWARGKIISSVNSPANGRVGLFPTNFVGPLPSVNSMTPQKPSVIGLIEGTIQSKSSSSISSRMSIAKPKEVAKVLYKYDAANPDELSLPEGALVTVLNKNCEDDGWFEGELDGMRGLFPENFVQLLPMTMESQPAVYTSASSPMSTSAAMSSSNEKISPSSPGVPQLSENVFTQPPILPAKPSKAGLLFGQKSNSPVATVQHSSQPPTARFRDSMSAMSNKGDSGANMVSLAGPKKMGEERKSMIAGLQSKLFGAGSAPPGGFAPHKSMSTTKRDESSSSVDITCAISDNSVGDENRLESMTKNRPKQVNKRPPSMGVQRLSLKPTLIDTSSQSQVLPSTSSAGLIPDKPSSPGVPAKPCKGALNVLAASDTEDLSTVLEAETGNAELNNAPKQRLAEEVKEEFVSRSEFDAYRVYANKRIEELQQRVAELNALLKTAEK